MKIDKLKKSKIAKNKIISKVNNQNVKLAIYCFQDNRKYKKLYIYLSELLEWS